MKSKWKYAIVTNKDEIIETFVDRKSAINRRADIAHEENKLYRIIEMENFKNDK